MGTLAVDSVCIFLEPPIIVNLILDFILHALDVGGGTVAYKLDMDSYTGISPPNSSFVVRVWETSHTNPQHNQSKV